MAHDATARILVGPEGATVVATLHGKPPWSRVDGAKSGALVGARPGGVDDYLELRRRTGGPAPRSGVVASSTGRGPYPSSGSLSGAQRRGAQKEVASIERRIDKRTAQVQELHRRMATHDHTDHVGLRRLDEQLRAVEAETAALEERWLELAERLGG